MAKPVTVLKTKMWNRTGTLLGDVPGNTKKCTLEGCKGFRIYVKWPTGQRTWPCACGLKVGKKGYWQIR